MLVPQICGIWLKKKTEIHEVFFINKYLKQMKTANYRHWKNYLFCHNNIQNNKTPLFCSRFLWINISSSIFLSSFQRGTFDALTLFTSFLENSETEKQIFTIFLSKFHRRNLWCSETLGVPITFAVGKRSSQFSEEIVYLLVLRSSIERPIDVFKIDTIIWQKIVHRLKFE